MIGILKPLLGLPALSIASCKEVVAGKETKHPPLQRGTVFEIPP